MQGKAETVEVLEHDGRRIRLLVSGFPVAYLNALRRLALSDVPSMAVDFVYFYHNNTGIHDEIIAHRLGLTVLESDGALARYKQPEECAGAPESDERCYVYMELDVSIPIDEDRGRYVKASELSISDPDVRPAYPDTVLFYLAPGQRVYFQAFARLGRGKEHAKWAPATVASLLYTPTVEYRGGEASRECLQCLEAYPEVRKLVESGRPGRVELPVFRTTSGLRYCSETACKGLLSVGYDRGKLILDVESSGALKPERIIYEAARCLERRARRLLDLIEEGAVK